MLINFIWRMANTNTMKMKTTMIAELMATSSNTLLVAHRPRQPETASFALVARTVAHFADRCPGSFRLAKKVHECTTSKCTQLRTNAGNQGEERHHKCAKSRHQINLRCE